MRRKLAYLGAILAPLALVLGLTAGNANAYSYAHVVMAGGGSWCLTTDVHTQSNGPNYVNPGDPVFLYACTTDLGNQHWAEVTYTGSGYIWFQSQLPDLNGDQMCLADTGDNQSDGTAWEIWYCENNVRYEELYNWIVNSSGMNQWCLNGVNSGPCISDDGGNRYNYNSIIVYHRELSAPYWQDWTGPGPN